MSYKDYPFAVTKNSVFLEFAFTVPSYPTTQMTQVTPIYINTNIYYVEADRLNPTLVWFGDKNGIVTVDYTKCTNIVLGSRDLFIAAVLAL